MILNKFNFCIFLFFILYQTNATSKISTDKDFNPRYLSNYLSAIISYNNQNNDTRHESNEWNEVSLLNLLTELTELHDLIEMSASKKGDCWPLLQLYNSPPACADAPCSSRRYARPLVRQRA